MKSLKSPASLILILLIVLSPLNASADVFGTDDETWERVFLSLKKINVRLANLETQEMASLKHQLGDLLRQIEEVKQTLPQLQGSVELNKSETLSNISRVSSKLSDLEAEVKNQVLAKINQLDQDYN